MNQQGRSPADEEGDGLEIAFPSKESEPDTEVQYVIVDTERKLDEMVSQLKRAQGNTQAFRGIHHNV